MRFLHTADWHIGKSLYSRPRLDEQEQVLNEILDIARREFVDCVLIAGDLFENLAPAAEAERLVCDALAEFAAARLTTIVVGGNHDHPRRLGALRKLGEPLRIHLRPEPARPDSGGIITLDKNGEQARIAVLPWVAEHRIVDIQRMMGPEDTWFEAYSANVAMMCKMLASGFRDDTINILAAHMFAFGAETSGSERAIHVAAPFAVKPAQLPAQAQYIALGHLHKPQELAGGTRIFYSGSPLQLDFGERGQQKRVVIVDLKAGLPADIRSIPLTSGRRLREITTTVERLPAVAEEAGDDFLRVIVKSERRVSGLSKKVTELLPNTLDVRQDVAVAEESDAPPDLAMATPVELFERYLREEREMVPGPEVLSRFQQLYAEARDEAN